MNLSKILNNLRQKNITKFILVGFFVFIFSGDITFAADDDFSGLAKILEFFTNFISLFLGLMTYLSSMFLSPEWINGSIFGLTEKFKDIWILVSNVVYFVFALIIIWIAFMNIIGNTSENYQLKQALPKFIVGILIVPFSWFLVQFVLSISAILTIASVNLPFDTFKDFKTATSTVNIKTQCTLDLKSTNDSDFFDCEGKTSLDDLMTLGNSQEKIYSVISLYTYGLVRVDEIDQIKFEDIGEIKKGIDLIVKVAFDLLFVIVYGILMIALGLVFMVRGFYIWLFIMLSPVFGLMYFFNKNDGAGEGFFKKINIKEFVALAMVPVYSMLALSFGMLFIKTVDTGLTGTTNVTSIQIKEGEDNSTKFQLSEKVYLQIKGAAGTKSSEDVSDFIGGSVDGALGIVGNLILKIFGIVVLWGAMMAAMRSSQITQAIVEPLHAFGGQVGGLMAKAPQYAPIFGGQSMQGLNRASSTFVGAYEGSANQKGVALGNKIAGKMGIGNSDLQEYNNLINGTSKKALEAESQKINHYKKLQSIVDPDKLSINTAHKEKYIDALEISGVKIDDQIKKEFMNAKNTSTMANAIQKIINSQADQQTKSALQKTYGTTTASIKNFISGDKADKVVGDTTKLELTNDDFDDLNKNDKTIDNVGTHIKVKKEGVKDGVGKGTIFVKSNGGNGAEGYTINVQSLKKTDKDLSNLSKTDKKEILDLYDKVRNVDDLGKILEKIGYENGEDIAKEIKNIYNTSEKTEKD